MISGRPGGIRTVQIGATIMSRKSVLSPREPLLLVRHVRGAQSSGACPVVYIASANEHGVLTLLTPASVVTLEGKCNARLGIDQTEWSTISWLLNSTSPSFSFQHGLPGVLAIILGRQRVRTYRDAT